MRQYRLHLNLILCWYWTDNINNIEVVGGWAFSPVNWSLGCRLHTLTSWTPTSSAGVGMSGTSSAWKTLALQLAWTRFDPKSWRRSHGEAKSLRWSIPALVHLQVLAVRRATQEIVSYSCCSSSWWNNFVGILWDDTKKHWDNSKLYLERVGRIRLSRRCPRGDSRERV